jgi:hypothetical protein
MDVNQKDLNIKQDWNSNREILRLLANVNHFRNQFFCVLRHGFVLKPNLETKDIFKNGKD